jgi:general secretion pathway protein D
MNLRFAAALVLALQLVPALGVAQVPVREPPAAKPPKAARQNPKLPPGVPNPNLGMPNPNLKPFPVQNPAAPGAATAQAAPAPTPTPAPTPAPGPAPTPAPGRTGPAPRQHQAKELTPEEQAARREAAREAARKRGRFQLDFDKAELADVIQTISDFTGKLFIVPENIRGKVTIVGPEDGTGFVTADEAYAAFLSALEANNWTVYPVGRYLKIVEKRAAANNNVWTYLDPDADVPNDERMITKLLKLKYVDVDSIQNPLKQLLSKDSQLVTMPPDTLIVTEIGLNLRRVEKIIAALDQPGGGEELRIIQIEYAAAADIADKLLQIFEEKGAPGRPGAARRTAKAAPAPAATPTDAGPQVAGAEGLEGGTVSISRVIPDERTNKLIVVASAKAFQRIEDLIRQLDIPTGDTGKVNVYYLENANAEDVAGTLQALTTGGSAAGRTTPSPRRGGGNQPAAAAGPAAVASAELFAGEVKISADKSTNSLVIVASAQDYKNLVRVIEKLDIPRRQVFVEAVIMEVNLRKNNQFGVGLHTGYAVETDEGIAPLVVGSQPAGSPSSLSIASLLSMGGFLAGLQGPAIPQVAALGLNIPSFGLVMQAAASNSDVNVLSTPHILTSDNEEAEITVGQNVPFQAGFAPQGLSNLLGNATGTTGATTAGSLAGSLLGAGGLSSFYAPIQRQNVELKLKIKPQINESDYIRMEVEEQTEEIAENDPTLGPTTAKRTAKTVIVARDQTTVVIGGLIQDRTINTVNKTPVLGDIPLLGRLFRHTDTTKSKTNLLLFLTPYIIQDQSDFRRIFERKMKEREEFIAAFYGTTEGYEVPIDYSRKAGPVARLSREVRAESQKLENGGEGAPGEKAIAPRAAPGQTSHGAAPRGTPAPPAANPAAPSAPGSAAPGAVTPLPVPGTAAPAPAETPAAPPAAPTESSPSPRDEAAPPAGSLPATPEPAPGEGPAPAAPAPAPAPAPGAPAPGEGE